MVWPRSSHAGRAAPKLTQGLDPQTWQKIQRETKKNLETNSNWWLQIRNRDIWCFPVPTMIWNRWRIIRNRCNLMARCNLWCCGQFKWNRYGHLKGPSKVKSKYTLNHLYLYYRYPHQVIEPDHMTHTLIGLRRISTEVWSQSVRSHMPCDRALNLVQCNMTCWKISFSCTLRGPHL